MKKVTIAILAKDKSCILNDYLKCIYNLTYPKKQINIGNAILAFYCSRVLLILIRRAMGRPRYWFVDVSREKGKH